MFFHVNSVHSGLISEMRDLHTFVSGSQTMTIHVADVNDEQPFFLPPATFSATVPEEQESGSYVLDIQAYDPDEGVNAYRYSTRNRGIFSTSNTHEYISSVCLSHKILSTQFVSKMCPCQRDSTGMKPRNLKSEDLIHPSAHTFCVLQALRGGVGHAVLRRLHLQRRNRSDKDPDSHRLREFA